MWDECVSGINVLVEKCVHLEMFRFCWWGNLYFGKCLSWLDEGMCFFVERWIGGVKMYIGKSLGCESCFLGTYVFKGGVSFVSGEYI